MFLINGKTLSQGVPFKDAEGNQYPANWLNLSTAEEKAAIGITEVADSVRADDRFYWDGDINNPKSLEDMTQTDEQGNTSIAKGLKSIFVAQNKAIAGSLLAQTDWAVTRKADIGVEIPASIATVRLAIRQKADQIEAAITACATVEELASLDLSYPVN